MKKYLLLAILTLLSLGAVTSDAREIASIVFTNTSTSAVSNTVAPALLSTQGMVTNGTLTSDALDMELKDLSGNAVPFMPAPANTALESFHLCDFAGPTSTPPCENGLITNDTTDVNDSGVGDVDLLPSTLAIGDAAYFCAQHQFHTLRIEVYQGGETQTTPYVLSWEFYNGTNWTAIENQVDLTDDTQAFTQEGINSVSWELLPGMSEAVVNSTVGYCVRARVTDAGTGTYTQPVASQAWYDTSVLWAYAGSIGSLGTQTNDLYIGFSDQGRESYLSFDGSNDMVQVSDDATVQNACDGGFTVEAWIYPRSDGENNAGRIYDKVDTRFFVDDDNGTNARLRFVYRFTGDDLDWRTDDRVLTLDAWNHAAVSYNCDSTSNTPTFYANGSSVDATVVQAPSMTRESDIGDDIRIGESQAGAGAFDGFIDDVRLWDDIRTSTEISDNYQSTLTGAEGGLLGLWLFEEGYDLTAADTHANGNDGAITGAFWESDYKKRHNYVLGDQGLLGADAISDEVTGDFVIEVRGYFPDTQPDVDIFPWVVLKNASVGIQRRADDFFAYAYTNATSTQTDLRPVADVKADVLSKSGCAAHFNCIDEIGANDGDTTRLFTSSTDWERGIFGMIADNIAAPDDSITGITLCATAKKAAGTGTMRVGIRLDQDMGAGSLDESFSADQPLSTSYVEYCSTFSTRPDGRPWQVSDIDNRNIEAIVELQETTGTSDARLTKLEMRFTHANSNATLSATSVSAGEHIIRFDNLGSAGAEYRLFVDNHLIDTEAEIAEADTSFPWVFGTYGAAAIYEYIIAADTDLTNDNSKFKYIKQAFDDAATITDITNATPQNATPSFPLLDATLLGDVKPFQSATAQAGSVSDFGQADVLPDIGGAAEGTGFQGSADLSSLPLNDFFTNLSNKDYNSVEPGTQGIPLAFFYLMAVAMLLIIILVGVAILTRSLFYAIGAACIVAVLFTGAGVAILTPWFIFWLAIPALLIFLIKGPLGGAM